MIEQNILLSPTQIFVSYSHKDIEQKEEVMTILRALPPGIKVEAWDDNRMLAGDDIDATIFSEIDQCKVFLALISRNYLASAYCKEEMKMALIHAEQRGCRVVPVVVRSNVSWRDYPIGQKLALPPDGKAPSDWKHEDQHWTAVEEGLIQILKNVHKSQPGSMLPDTINSQIEEDAGEYAHAEDWVIRTIDHTEQHGKVEEQFEPTSAGNPDRAYFHFNATPDDWPPALADHTYIKLARHAPDTDSFATELRKSGLGNNAIWKALLQKIPCGRNQGSLQEEQQLVLDWINGRHLTVLYVVVNAEKERKLLPEMIKGACTAFDALPRFKPGVRLILFFACLKDTGKCSIFQRISGMMGVRKITDMCCALPPLRELNRVDIEEWLSGFTLEQECRYRKEQLRSDLGALFEEGVLRYETVRSHLIDGDALRRARRK